MARTIEDLHPKIDKLRHMVGDNCQSIAKVAFPYWVKRSGVLLTLILCGLIVILVFVPWQQTSYATGAVVPFDPNDRMQDISSPVKGIISKWYVVEGSQVEQGDPLAEIRDVDPQYLQRLTRQKEAVEMALEAAEAAAETSQKNLSRQKLLAEKGIKSQRAFELARLEFNKFVSEAAAKRKELADLETKVARQQSQLIIAPRDGIIMRVFFPQGGEFVKVGDKVVSLAPSTTKKVVELFVEGNDLPFIHKGSKARLQFEGWPAIQVSGWPSTAIGTFESVVKVIDPGENSKGLFRILVFPPEDSEWPSDNYLRQGVRVKGWFQLGVVPLGYEIWRQFNDFPPDISPTKTKKLEKGLGLQLGKNVGKIGK